MTLQEIQSYAEAKLLEHDLTDWQFKFGKSKRAVGMCKFKPKVIEISKHWIVLLEDDEIKDVILHEIAHALTPHDKGHCNAWKAACRRIGARAERVHRNSVRPDPAYVAVVDGKIAQTYYRKPSQRIIKEFATGKRWFDGYKGHKVRIMSYEVYQQEKQA